MQSTQATSLLNWLKSEQVYPQVQALAFADPSKKQSIDETIDQFARSVINKIELSPSREFISSFWDQLKEISFQENPNASIDKIIRSLLIASHVKIKNSNKKIKEHSKTKAIFQQTHTAHSSELFKMNRRDFEKARTELNLNIDDEMALLAQYIECNKLKINSLPRNTNWDVLGKYLTYVDLRGVNNAEKITSILDKCKKATTVYVSNSGITSLPDLPHCVFLNCEKCYKLKALPNLPACSFLTCSECKSLKYLPELPLCIRLKCDQCESLEEIPELLFCLSLECNGCKKITGLPALPNCISLRCAYCLFTQLPDLPYCEILDCTKCTRLQNLPSLPACEILVCQNCIFVELPDLPVCTILICSNCIYLTRILSLPLCEIFKCSECTSLEELPLELPALKELHCQHCINLFRLPNMLRCISLDCSGCLFLESIPDLPVCQKFNYTGCLRLINLPNFPRTCNIVGIVSAHIPSLAIIDFEEISKAPKKILRFLDYFLTNNSRLPSIRYRTQGIEDITDDIGGVSRDCISRLIENLFTGTGNEFLRMHSGIPIMQENEEESYRALGKIFALCLFKNSYFKTGPLFLETAYQALITLPFHDTEGKTTEQWFIKQYLHLIGYFSEIGTLFDLPAAQIPNLSPKALQTLGCLLDPDEPKLITNDCLTPELIGEIRQKLLEVAFQNERLCALWCIGEGMMDMLKIEEWQEIIQEGAEGLMNRIQGVLDAATLLSNMEWHQGPSVTAEDFRKIQGFLQKWISEATLESLVKFVRAVTGNNSLTPMPLKVQICNGNKFPVGKTCIFTLYLTDSDSNQLEFNEKLETLLACDGFQLV